MQKVLAILSIVLVTLRSQLVSAEACGNLRQATSTFKPTCEGQDVYINWPNYENASSYYHCNGIENPQLIACPPELYFCYVLQKCVDCSDYIPPSTCENLPTTTSPNCTPISGGTPSTGGSSTGTTLPTPRYPSSTATTSSTKTSTTKSTTKTTITTPSSNSTKTTLPSTDPTPPTIGDSTTPPPTSTDIPPPPSPSTQNTLIPLPPTPPPTPPNVSVEPPYVSPKPGS